MNTGKIVFSQVMEHMPLWEFRKCVKRYRGNYKVKSFKCLDQFLCMAFAQLTYRESLRDIEACLRSMQSKLYHMGIRSRISRNNLSNANNTRNWRIYADFAQVLIHNARRLYADEYLGIDLDNTIYALDSTTIELCLSLFPWAGYSQTQAGMKLHTLLDLRGNIPSVVEITDVKVHDVRILDLLIPEPGSFYIMDRGYLDFERLYTLHQSSAFFVVRSKTNIKSRRLYSHGVDKSTGLRSDQTVVLTGVFTPDYYPDKLRKVVYYDKEHSERLIFFTNNFKLSAETIAQLYKQRWKIELFFKWIKQHLRIKKFFGTSFNAVKTQIWIAVSVYVLVALIKKRLDVQVNLNTILQILSVTAFEKIPLSRLLNDTDCAMQTDENHKQLLLFKL
ncbi:MAG: IS4 family transposase [Candidatus Omnitrophica bacterium]|nr:IS4 family transposase [Candidatus Omnitrophota bacterium]